MALGPKRIMIVGDPQQLPSTIFSWHSRTRGLDKSLQERLMFEEKCPYTMLDTQYRMKPEISVFPSATFYNGSITNGSNVTRQLYDSPLCRTLVRNQPYIFIQVDGFEQQQPSGSYQNFQEAKKVVAVLMELREKVEGTMPPLERLFTRCSP